MTTHVLKKKKTVLAHQFNLGGGEEAKMMNQQVNLCVYVKFYTCVSRN